jgi:penicillin-binding protein 1A
MKKIFIIGSLILALLLLVPIAFASLTIFEVFTGKNDHLKREKIIEILSKETTLYYSDGQTQLGSLFGSEHRQYVYLKDIPKNMLNAIVASEDDQFYKHKGVDFISTARAAINNVISKKRQGASTITQQTVKNLYGRPITNVKTKLTEALNAFKMERIYKKEEILEFYLNQFHVTGNGRGLGVSAKYYFNKETENLSLTECAFIAGSVKGPEKYNPFTKRTTEAQQKARTEAKQRKNYVLKRMMENKFITIDEFKIAEQEDIPFQQGKFQFNEIAVTELVTKQLARKEILKALNADSIESIANMGLRITTTLEKQIQVGAQYAVRQNLSRLEMILSGFETDTEAQFSFIQKPEHYEFYTAKIESIDKTTGKESVTLSFGTSQCFVPTEGIERVAKLTDQAFNRGIKKSKENFLEKLVEGKFILASVKPTAEQKQENRILCDIEKRPKIQGGLLVLDKGKIISMIGGFHTHEYNRAVFAKRQPGSTFKSLTYYGALQLGWQILEPLLNIRNVYSWQGQFYYPRADHAPETLETNIIGANSKSENLASVYLLSRILDKLTPSQFYEIIELLGLSPKEQNEQQIIENLSRKFNIKFTEQNLKAGIFDQVKQELLQDISFTQDENLRVILKSMNYGNGFDEEISRVFNAKPSKFPKKEKNLRLNILKNRFTRWYNISTQAENSAKILKNLAENGFIFSELKKEDISVLKKFKLLKNNKIGFFDSDFFQPNIISGLFKPIETVIPEKLDSPENPNHLVQIYDAIKQNSSILGEENIFLDGIFPVSTIKEIETQISVKYSQIKDSSQMEKLFFQQDFKYSLGMYYLKHMVAEMGVDSDLQWVPSFPLGVNVVSLAELSLAFQTMLEGKLYKYFEEGSDNQVLAIKRIEDMSGNLLWEGEAKEIDFSDNSYSEPMMSVLRGPVTNGTAYAAFNNITLKSFNPETKDTLEKLKMRIPTFGKTGTTNDYTNATFVGYLPYPETENTEKLNSKNAYTIAAYVGYDNNQQMRKNGFKVAGGTGALPAWIGTAQTLVQEEKFAEKLNWKQVLEKNEKEIPFDYGQNSQKITFPIHTSFVAFEIPNAGENVSETATDLNLKIEDYKQGTSNFSGYISGRAANGTFIPFTKFSPFIPSKRRIQKESSGEFVTNPDFSADKKDPDAANTPISTPKPIEEMTLPEDNFLDEVDSVLQDIPESPVGR